jgi:anti-sigma factor RsiW
MTDRSLKNQYPDPAIDPKILLRYVSGELDDATARQLEARALEDPMLADAIEGLQRTQDQVRLEQMAYQLNQEMRKRLSKKQKRKSALGFTIPTWWNWVILTLLLLIVIAFILIKKISP